MKKSFALLVCLLIFSGCTTIGPFVTNISSDSAGGLIVEKCKLKVNSFLSTVNMDECKADQLKVK